MFVNILIAVVLAIIAAIVSGLAGHLAATKTWHRWCFWGGGIAMIALIAVQTTRNELAQAKLQAQLDKIQQNTEKPQNITVQPPQVILPPPAPQKQRAYMSFGEPQLKREIGSNLSVDFKCVTKTEVPARKVSCNGQFSVIPLEGRSEPSEEQEDNAYQVFEKQMRPWPEKERPTVGQGEIFSGISSGPIFTKEMETQLEDGAVTILLTGAMFFRDDAGRHKVELCRWLQSPAGKGNGTWHVCHKHEGIIY